MLLLALILLNIYCGLSVTYSAATLEIVFPRMYVVLVKRALTNDSFTLRSASSGGSRGRGTKYKIQLWFMGVVTPRWNPIFFLFFSIQLQLNRSPNPQPPFTTPPPRFECPPSRWRRARSSPGPSLWYNRSCGCCYGNQNQQRLSYTFRKSMTANAFHNRCSLTFVSPQGHLSPSD